MPRNISRILPILISLLVMGSGAQQAFSLTLPGALPRLMPADEPPSGGIPDPCEGLPVITTPISVLAAGTCGIEGKTGCSAGPKEVVPLEPGCYKQDVTLSPLLTPTTTHVPDPVIVLVGRDPDKTIIVGQGTQNAVIRFVPNADGQSGGEVHGVKIKPATNQAGVYFQNAPLSDWVYTNGAPYPKQESIVQNVIIMGGQNGVIMNGVSSEYGYNGRILNSTIVSASSHAIIAQNGILLEVRNNLIAFNGGSAFSEDNSIMYVDDSYNDIWGNGNNNHGDRPVSNSHNIFVNPLLYPGKAYQLRPTSPLIKAGSILQPSYIGDPTPPTNMVPVDIGAWGKPDTTPPYGTYLTAVSRLRPAIQFGYMYGTDNVAIQWFAFYRSTSPTGPWVFDHTCIKGDFASITNCPEFSIQNDPTPSPSDQNHLDQPSNVMLYTKIVPLDSSYNWGAESNVAAPPTEPIPFQWAPDRSSAACNSNVDMKIRFIGFSKQANVPPPDQGFTDTIDQMIIWHCRKSDASWSTCDTATAGVINQPQLMTWYGMHVPCDTKAHYYLFRAIEKVVVLQTYNFSSFSVNRMSMAYYPNYSGPSPAPAMVPTPLRICMVDPDTCNDCQFTNGCDTAGHPVNPCPDGGVCPQVTVAAPNGSSSAPGEVSVQSASPTTTNMSSVLDDGGDVMTDPSGVMYQMVPDTGPKGVPTAGQGEPNRCPAGDMGTYWNGIRSE